MFIWADDTLLNLSQDQYKGDAPDMGAIEYDPASINTRQFTKNPDNYILISAYPNPFNSSTTITYALPTQSPITLKVYNTRGQLVDVLLDRVMPAGRHSVVWVGSGFSTGVYIVKMSSLDFQFSRKILLVK